MVNCISTATNQPCPSSGAMAGLFLYPTEVNVADGATMRLQIMTNAYECDDTGYVPTEYCVDWEDGTKTSGTFPSGYNVPKNVELSHVYHFADRGYDSNAYNPSVTIATACGGVRTVNTDDAGRSCMVYVWAPGTNPIPPPNMSTGYKLHPDFNFASCAGIFPDCSGSEVDLSTCQKCVGGFWARDLSNTSCDSTGATVCNGKLKCVNGIQYEECTKDGITSYVGTGYPCDNTGGAGYVPPSTPGLPVGTDITGEGGGTDIVGSIMNFYDNNKMVSLLGIALLGGFVLFGGGKD